MAYSEFIQSQKFIQETSDKGSIQIIFDFMFLEKLLRGGWQESPEIERLNESNQQIVLALRSKVIVIVITPYLK